MALPKTPERPQPGPLTVFIQPEKAPVEMLKAVVARSGKLIVETPKGDIGVELYALPAPGGETQTPFLQRVFGRKKAAQPVPVQVVIEPTAPYDKFDKTRHTPLMGWYPYAVLQDETRYGVGITAPSVVAEQAWSEQKERARTTGGLYSPPVTVTEDGVEFTVREVFRQRKGLVAVVRVDGKHPLVQREEKRPSGSTVNIEMLIGGFEPVSGEEGVSSAAAIKRVTQISDNKKKPEVGEEVESNARVEDLIFRLVSEEGVEAPEQEKGVVEVIVFEAIEDEVTEVIKTPKMPKIEVWQPGGSERYSQQNLAFGNLRGATKGGGSTFHVGETLFGTPKREKVKIGGVTGLKPLAAFRMVLVGENLTEGLEMKEAQPEIVTEVVEPVGVLQ